MLPGTFIGDDSVETMMKRYQGRQCGHKTCIEEGEKGQLSGLCPLIIRQDSPALYSSAENTVCRTFKGPFFPLSTMTYLAALPSLSLVLCLGLQVREAKFHFFNLSQKYLVTDLATWHPLSHCGSGMLTKKVIFQPS